MTSWIAGLVTARWRRTVPPHPGRPLVPMITPNGTWTADFKGQFKSGIRWNRHWVCVTHTRAGEYVGLEEVGDGLWDVYFGPLKLGRLDERLLRIADHKGRTVRKQVSPITLD